ncbi:MAG: DUF2207 domain-containing protein [Propionibacteriaceae bacterium]
MKRAIAALVLGVATVVALPTAAYADEDDWSIPRYDVTATAAPDGTVDVRLDFDFDFSDTEGHGPYVTLPLRQAIEGDPDHYRSFSITDIRASSPSGAPAGVDTETDGGALAIKVGDEDIEVQGRQSYQLAYRIKGVVNPGVGAAGEDEIFWNIIGSQWEVPLNDITVTLTGPAAVGRSACFVGKVGSTTACDQASASADSARYAQASVEPGSGLTVLADWPAGTFVDAQPVLVPRRNLGNTFTLNPLTGALAGAVVVLGGAALLQQARRRGRDQQYLGLTPGLTPTGADTGSTTVRDRRAPVAVQFTPPAGVRAGELGTLVDEVAHPHDVTATIVDLAVRGHLRIEEVPADDPAKAKPKDKSWRLVKLDRVEGQQKLLDYERLIFNKLFASGDSVELDQLGESFKGALGETQTKLYEAVTERGWFSANPRSVRMRWYGLGAALVVGGAVLALVLALTLGWGLIGVAVALVGVVTLVLAHGMPARTAEGTAVLAQTLGFKTYLETAEAEQLKFEEGEDIFSRYLPYAIAFGVAEHWAKVFADLAAQGRWVPEPTWYVGAQYGLFAAGGSGFSESLGAFSQSATSSMTSATYGAGGGSGASGGFSGGGVGGGGGGGW